MGFQLPLASPWRLDGRRTKTSAQIDKREGYQSCARPRERLVWSYPCQKNWDRSCGFVKAIIVSIVHNDSIPREILRIEGAKARPASASSNGNTVPCFHKRYGMGPELRCLSPLVC